MVDRGSLSHSGYAGDLLPAAARELLAQERVAQLVDVRTTAEWGLVGLPDLSPLDREPLLIEWQSFPSMTANPHFIAQTKGFEGDLDAEGHRGHRNGWKASGLPWRQN